MGVGGDGVNLTVWMLKDYGPSASRYVQRLDLQEKEVIQVMNYYKIPNETPKVTYFPSEQDALAALSRLKEVMA